MLEQSTQDPAGQVGVGQHDEAGLGAADHVQRLPGPRGWPGQLDLGGQLGLDRSHGVGHGRQPTVAVPRSRLDSGQRSAAARLASR